MKNWILNNGDFYLEYIGDNTTLSTQLHIYTYNNRKYIYHNSSTGYNNELDDGYLITNLVDSTAVHLDQDLITSWDDYETNLVKQVYNGDVTFNIFRLNIRSNYTFNNPIYFNSFIDTINAVRLHLISSVLFESITPQIHITPKLVGDNSYLYYIDFLVPNIDTIIDNINVVDTLGNLLLQGDNLHDSVLNVSVGECVNQVKNIVNISDNLTEEYTYFKLLEQVGFKFNSTTINNGISGLINEVSDYFILQPIKENESITSHINTLSNKLNTTFLLYSVIDLYVQYDTTFQHIDSFSSIKDKNFDEPIRFRPIILNAYKAISFKIVYTFRIFDNISNISDEYISEYVSHNTHKYGENIQRINVSQPIIHNVYNKKVNNIVKYTVSNTGTNTIKYETEYYDSNQITVNNQQQNKLIITVNDVNTNLKFNIQHNEVNLNLGNNSYLLVFIKNNGDKLEIINKFDDNINPQKGELLFSLTDKQVTDILNSSNNNFYITYNNPNNKSVLYTGSWISAEQKNEEEIITANIKLTEELDKLKADYNILRNEFNDYKLNNKPKQYKKYKQDDYIIPRKLHSKTVVSLKNIK